MSYMLRPKEETNLSSKDKVPNLYIGLTFMDLKPYQEQLEKLKKINGEQKI